MNFHQILKKFFKIFILNKNEIMNNLVPFNKDYLNYFENLIIFY